MALRRMPEEVRTLRHPWRTVTDRVPHLTPELEREFRFGQRVARTERGFLMGGTIKGGSSSMWYPAGTEQFEAYLAWREVEGIVDRRDENAYAHLRDFLAVRGVDLQNGQRSGFPEGREGSGFNPELGIVYELTLGVLRALPESHVRRPQLRRVQLGGWGPDGAKASAYHNATVMMYDFAVRGARRTFLGLLLHELGHAHEHALGPAALAGLEAAYRPIAHADAFYALEFLLDPASRRRYQRLVFNEFLAETYLVYAACGQALRRFIDDQPAAVHAAWATAYALFRESFDGVEYE